MDLSSTDMRQELQEFGNERTQRIDAVAHGDQYDDRNRESGAILLIFQVPVARYHYIEMFGSAPQKLAIAEPCPPGLAHCLNFVTYELSAEVAWQGFVKQDAHLR